ncbi:MAG: PqiC family protein, partial [Opitutaceae bacterium]
AIDRVGFTTATGPATLHVAGKTRWAGPLGAMTRLVLARDLASRLPGATVLMPGDPVPPGGVREVRVNIQDFMPGRSGRVSLEADWTIAAPDRQTILHRGRFHVALPGGGKPAAEARTMSETLGRLADAIADAL